MSASAFRCVRGIVHVISGQNEIGRMGSYITLDVGARRWLWARIVLTVDSDAKAKEGWIAFALAQSRRVSANRQTFVWRT